MRVLVIINFNTNLKLRMSLDEKFVPVEILFMKG
jgi:hypothetical protein